MQGRFQEACAEYECALAEDGANREAKVLLEMAVKAFRVQCECVQAMLDALPLAELKKPLRDIDVGMARRLHGSWRRTP